jgi:hypothetical protein
MELEKENENPEKRYPPLPLEKLNAQKIQMITNPTVIVVKLSLKNRNYHTSKL